MIELAAKVSRKQAVVVLVVVDVGAVVMVMMIIGFW